MARDLTSDHFIPGRGRRQTASINLKWQQAWARVCAMSRGKTPPSVALVEEYEPRLLYSADFAPNALALAGGAQVVEQRLMDSSGEFAAVQTESVAQRVELLVVDAGASAQQTLLEELCSADGRRIEVLVLDADTDGIAQISAALAGRDNLATLHILSHGANGELRLGSTTLNASTLSARSVEIASWGNALTETGDILLYGCDVAADASGRAFVQQLSALTGADVAASANATGNANSGGDWNLEVEAGAIESALALGANATQHWTGLLANPVLSGAINLAAINEDDVTSSGTLVSALIAGQVTDPDAGALFGIAVTAVLNTNGSWEYSTNGGVMWNPFVAPSTTNALLLAADADNRVRFVPNADFNGTVTAGLTFRAWDQTSGTDGGTANISTTTATVRDEFGAVAYNNNDGTTGSTWSTSWTEVGDDASAASGNFKVAGGSLVLTPALLSADSIFRQANLAGATSATLSFSFNNTLSLLGEVQLQVSNGGAPSTLATFSASGNTGSGPLSFDISGFIDADTRITFAIPSVLSIGGSLSVDNVQILYGPASFSSVSASSSITVNAVNDAPLNAVPGAQATNEDTVLVFSSGNGNQISVADPDAATNPVEVTLGVTNGTLSLAGIGGLTFTTGDGTADASMVFTGTLANLNAALNGMSFTPVANYNGPALLTLTTNDQGNSGSGGALNDSDSVNINVTEVNDAPLALDDGLASVAEDSGLRVISFASLTGNDSAGPANEAGQSLTITALGSAVGGTAVINGTNVEFTPTADFNGAASFDYTVQDNGTSNGAPDFKTDTGAVSFTITEVNDAPVNTVPGAQATNEDTVLVFSSGNGNQISVADPDAATNPVQVTLGVTNGTLSLAGIGGLTFTTGDGTADASMVFTGTLANLNAALNGMSFTPVANYNGPALLTLTTNDQGNSGSGGALNDSDSVNINVTEVNDAPLALDDGLASVAEDSGLRVISFASLTGNDSAGPANEAGQSLTITALGSAVGGTAVINGTNVEFTPTADFNGAASFDYTVQDNGTSNGAPDFKTDTGAVSFTITEVNDAPLNTVGGGQTVAEDTALTFTGANLISVNDVDGNLATTQLTVANATLTVDLSAGATIDAGANGTATLRLAGTQTQINAALASLNYQALADYNGADTLTVLSTDSAGTPLSDTDTVAITLSAVSDIVADTLATNEDTAISANPITGTNGASADSFEDAGRAITSVTQGNNGAVAFTAAGLVSYAPNANFNGPDSFSYTVVSGGVSETATVTVNVSALNDAPLATNLSAPETYTEDSALNPTDIVVSDIDSANLTVTLTLSDLAAGSLNTATSGAVTSTFAGGVWTAAGALADVNTLLAGLTFTPAADYNANFTIAISVSDGVAPALTGTKSMIAFVFVPVPTSASDATVPAPTLSLTSAIAAPPVADRSTVEPSENATGGDTAGAGPRQIPNLDSAFAPVNLPGADDPGQDGIAGDGSLEASHARNASRHGTAPSPEARSPAVELASAIDLQQAAPIARSDAQIGVAATRNSTFIGELDRLRSSVREEAALQQRIVAASVAVGAGISVGYVLWLLRGGVLLSSLLSSLPVWRFVDPLPVLARLKEDEHEDEDDESLESMVDTGADAATTRPEAGRDD
jgi:hypothetical protein